MRRTPLSFRRRLVLLVAAWLAVASTASADGARAKGSARVPTYREMVRDWHTPPDDDPALTPQGRPLLVLEIINTQERIELTPLRDDGGFAPDELVRAAHALRDQRSDSECATDARMLDLVYRIQVHFKAKALRVISAFRAPRRRNSRHGTGSALDLVVPGIKDIEVARFARSLGFVGVGLYTRSGFVHLDSRTRSYFWIDASGPGQRSRTMQVYAKAAAASDADAIERGETPPGQGSDGDDGDHGGRSTAASVTGADAVRRRSASSASTSSAN